MSGLPPIPEQDPWTSATRQKAKLPRVKREPEFVLDTPPKPAYIPPMVTVVPEVPPPPVKAGLTPRQVAHARALIAEAQKRSIEALKLYEPLPSQLAFHTSMSRQRISRGGNRSGKTTVTCAELAMAVTGQHWQPGKYPERDGLAIVVAKDLDKVGEVIWRKLGRADAFRIVKDPETGVWRAYRPATDAGLTTKPAPPMIPPRLIKEIAWESKKSNIPKKVILTTGWEISFYSSKSDPFSIQGTKLNIVLFDEEIVHRDWYPEAWARLVDNSGWLMWGATPQTGTQQLYDLHLRAEAWTEEVEADPSKANEVPPVAEHFMSIWDNPFIPAKAKQEFVDSLDDDEKRVRVDGEFAITGFKVYEAYFFPRGLHLAEPFPVPDNWTRFCVFDPGAQVGAVLFAAVPPMKYDGTPGVDPKLYGDYVYLYDEVYLRQCDARKLALRMKVKLGGQTIQEFVIDHRGGRLTEIGSGKAQPLDSKVLTPHGWRTMGEILPGDLVTHPGGGFSRVKAVYPQGEKQVYRVTMRDGSTTRCCAEHLWHVTTPNSRFRGRPPRLMSLGDLASGSLFLNNETRSPRWSVPMVSPVNFWPITPRPLIDPYLLGFMLGDGCFEKKSSISVSTADEEIAGYIAAVLPEGLKIARKPDSKYDWRITGDRAGTPNPVIRALKAYGLHGVVSKDKFIPDDYLRGSVGDRIAVLRGLMDSDGSADGTATAEFSTISPALRDGVVELVRSLGGTATWTERPACASVFNGVPVIGRHPSYRVHFKTPPRIVPFRLKRKAIRYKSATKYPPSRAIASIEPDGLAECQCIAVDAPDGLYVTDDYIVTHNTPEQQYKEAFKAEGVCSVKTGNSFTWGSDDVNGGILRVKDFLRVREDGTAKIRVIRGACPNLVSEMERYQWKVVNGEVTETPLKKRDHLVDCLRYLAMLPSLRFVKPKVAASKKGTAFDAFKAFTTREKNRKVSEKGEGVTLG